MRVALSLARTSPTRPWFWPRAQRHRVLLEPASTRGDSSGRCPPSSEESIPDARRLRTFNPCPVSSFPNVPIHPTGGNGADTYLIQSMGQEQGPYSAENLRQLAVDGHLKTTSMVRRTEVSDAWFPASEVPGVFSDKEWLTALAISFFVGIFGIDRFYLGHIGVGIAKLLTLGGCGIWAMIDVVIIAMRKVTDSQGRALR